MKIYKNIGTIKYSLLLIWWALWTLQCFLTVLVIAGWLCVAENYRNNAETAVWIGSIFSGRVVVR